jgi:hypothetical protein
MINTRYNKPAIEIPFSGVKIIDPNIEQLINKEEYERFTGQ